MTSNFDSGPKPTTETIMRSCRKLEWVRRRSSNFATTSTIHCRNKRHKLLPAAVDDSFAPSATPASADAFAPNKAPFYENYRRPTLDWIEVSPEQPSHSHRLEWSCPRPFCHVKPTELL